MSTKTATKSTKKTATKQATTPVAKQVETKAETKKTTKRVSKKEEQVVVPVPEPQPVETEPQQTEGRQRRQVTRESYETELKALIEFTKERINAIRSSGDKKKVTGTRDFGAIGKRLKQLLTDFNKVSKRKNNSGNRKPNNNSGFMKPVPVSKEMCKFAGWEPSEMRSRVDVTKWLCAYVKNHELRNPAFKKEIWPDEKLAKLLRVELVDDKEIGRKVPKEKLEYCDIQKKIQVHFPKDGQ